MLEFSPKWCFNFNCFNKVDATIGRLFVKDGKTFCSEACALAHERKEKEKGK
jgi:hypothetical protein